MIHITSFIASAKILTKITRKFKKRTKTKEKRKKTGCGNRLHISEAGQQKADGRRTFRALELCGNKWRWENFGSLSEVSSEEPVHCFCSYGSVVV